MSECINLRGVEIGVLKDDEKMRDTAEMEVRTYFNDGWKTVQASDVLRGLRCTAPVRNHEQSFLLDTGLQ